ncbi:MAG: hypothetical protein ACSLFK_15340 [Gemmatimonadaceae bacterium]
MSNRNELPFAGGAIAIRFMLAAGALLVASAIPAEAQVETSPPLDTGYVIYDEGPINLAFGVGLRIPSYNRVDGVAVGWGPDIRLAGGTIKLAPSVTYRSHIGAVDPSITGTIEAGPLTEIRIAGGRSTFSNDTWIKSDLMNSLSALGVGSDARNYFRADRGEVEIFHRIVSPATTVTPSIGVLHEFAWSTGIPEPHTSAPWSFFGAKDDLKMRRMNPAVTRGHTTSGLGGLRVDYELQETKAGAAARVEHAFDAPLVPGSDSEGFTQYTVDARAKFPTFGLQTFTFKGHAVFTGGEAPPQRYAYLGGSSTLSTVDLLALGGDRLLFVEGEYHYPLTAPLVPFVGAPVLSLRYAAGSAGVDDLPDFIQNVGFGLSLKVIKFEFHLDPSYREAPFRDKTAFSVSLALPF